MKSLGSRERQAGLKQREKQGRDAGIDFPKLTLKKDSLVFEWENVL
jgi:hypothetical protein